MHSDLSESMSGLYWYPVVKYFVGHIEVGGRVSMIREILSTALRNTWPGSEQPQITIIFLCSTLAHGSQLDIGSGI